jgi:hypothetical protein
MIGQMTTPSAPMMSLPLPEVQNTKFSEMIADMKLLIC